MMLIVNKESILSVFGFFATCKHKDVFAISFYVHCMAVLIIVKKGWYQWVNFQSRLLSLYYYYQLNSFLKFFLIPKPLNIWLLQLHADVNLVNNVESKYCFLCKKMQPF